MKKVLRFLGFTILGIVVILLGLGAYINFKPRPTYADVPIPDIQVSKDSATLALGRKLVLMSCQGCHRGGENAQLEGMEFTDANADALGKFHSPNITQDMVHGIGSYSEGELYRLLRTGVKKNNELGLPIMPKFHQTKDSDIKAMIAYLKYGDDPAVSPSSKQSPDLEPTFLSKALFTFAWKPGTYKENLGPVPSMSDSVAYGKYAVEWRYYCAGCHSANIEKFNREDPSLTPNYLGGGHTFAMKLDGGYDITTPSLWMDGKSEVSKWTIDEFVGAVMWGQRPSGIPYKEPMHPFTEIDTAEARSIYHYLKSLDFEKIMAASVE